MRQLDARRRSVGVKKLHDLLERRDLLVVPQSHIGVGDAALRCHRRRLDDDETEAAQGKAAEMNEMPVVGHAVARRVLAHGGNEHAVLEGEIAQCVGLEQV